MPSTMTDVLAIAGLALSCFSLGMNFAFYLVGRSRRNP
jgi:hypothetical protein